MTQAMVLTLLLEFVVHVLQDGGELLTRCAPASAEVHRQHFPVQRLRSHLTSVRLTTQHSTAYAQFRHFFLSLFKPPKEPRDKKHKSFHTFSLKRFSENRVLIVFCRCVQTQRRRQYKNFLTTMYKRTSIITIIVTSVLSNVVALHCNTIQ